MTDFQKELLDEFEIPVRERDQKIWLVRTESGRFYRDFTKNGYVALGWDRVPIKLIQSKTVSSDEKKSEITSCYPGESRPGLILSQLRTFYDKMMPGDFILIPSESSRELHIGKLGEIISEVKHAEDEDEYEKCEYSHKRRVEWIKALSPEIDVYLNKTLNFHQAVTDVTKYSDILYRNIYPYYINGDSIHLTFKKTADSNYSLRDSIDLEVAVMKIFQAVSGLYRLPDNTDSFKIKTAVGSPGIIEIIVENFNSGNLVAAFIVLLVAGGSISRDENGKISFSLGVSSIIDKVNTLINDHKNRELTDAEIGKINAETDRIKAETKIARAESRANIRRTEAEINKTEASAGMIGAETNVKNAEALKLLSTVSPADLQAAAGSITQPLKELQQISVHNDISLKP